MIRSMTGFGEAERQLRNGRVRVQIRTVNHRFFNLSLRVPAEFERHEVALREWLRALLPRGHVLYALSVEPDSAAQAAAALELDRERARRYRDLLLQLKEELELPGEVDLKLVAGRADLFRAPPGASWGWGPGLPEVDEEMLRAVTEEAARAVVAMREAEGERLARDLRERLDAVEARAVEIETRAPERAVMERDRLREAIAKLTESQDVDADRLAREVAYLAERWDINEELVRLRSHVALFRRILESDAAEPVGKRLGFLVQEMHREATTISAKANDEVIAHATVAMREEIERIREQVENVE